MQIAVVKWTRVTAYRIQQVTSTGGEYQGSKTRGIRVEQSTRMQYVSSRQALFRAAGTYDHNQLVATPRGIRAAARWLVRSGTLQQYALAAEQLASGEQHGGEDGGSN